MKQRFPVQYEFNGCVFSIHKPEKVLSSHSSEPVLYYHDTANRTVVMVDTVAENLEGYTQRKYYVAVNAQLTQGLFIYPYDKDLKLMVHANLIANCPVTINDINAAHKIFGLNVASLKGKTSRRQT